MEKKNERIFISYKRVDMERVDALRKDIEQATGEPCWIDRDGIESDAQFVEVIMDAIDHCEIFLFMRSKEHNNITNHSTDWTIREVNYALSEKKRIVFVCLDNTPLPRWFKFMFPNQQEIDASDEEKLKKFYADLRSWLNVEGKEEEVKKEESLKEGKEENLKERKAKEEDISEVVNSILVHKEKVERKREEDLRQKVETGELSLTQYYIGTLKGHERAVNAVSFSSDGRKIVSTSDDNYGIYVWDSYTGRKGKLSEWGSLYISSYSAAFNPDGKCIVSTDGKNIRIWHTKTGKCLKKLKGHKKNVRSTRFSPDGNIIVSASDDKTIRIWNVGTGKSTILKSHEDKVNFAAFSPDGKKIVSASNDKTIRIWDIETGNCITILKGHTSYVNTAEFSPDGKKIVSASNDDTIRIWDIETGNCINRFTGSGFASFSPDGKKIVSREFFKDFCIWNIETGECIRKFEGHSNSVTSAAFSPDGKRIVSASRDCTIRIWDISDL